VVGALISGLLVPMRYRLFCESVRPWRNLLLCLWNLSTSGEVFEEGEGTLDMNAVKTTLLLGLLSGLLIVGGGAIAGERGLAYGLVMAVAMNFFSYFFSEKMALLSARAQRVSENEYPEIYARLAPIVGALAERLGIPMPKLWVTPDLSPNAFATGRNPKHASVAVTSGILQLMKEDELTAVLAHELGHVKNRDILISSIAATLASAITYLARMAMWFGGGRRDDGRRDRSPVGGLLMIFLAPMAAGLIRMAISRTREFSADTTSAHILGTAQPMINALEKLDSVGKQIPLQASPSMSHMYIMQPFSGATLMRLFSTHPSTEKRIAALRALPREPKDTKIAA
jgi:heat shock protein HtpX